MRSVLAYTSARIVIFIATFGVLYLLGAKSWLGLLLAVLISGVISYVLLAKRRDEMSAAVVASAQEGRRKFNQARTKEDLPD
jgi:Protein of unknown function (DUF4229)